MSEKKKLLDKVEALALQANKKLSTANKLVEMGVMTRTERLDLINEIRDSFGLGPVKLKFNGDLMVVTDSDMVADEKETE